MEFVATLRGREEARTGAGWTVDGTALVAADRVIEMRRAGSEVANVVAPSHALASAVTEALRAG